MVTQLLSHVEVVSPDRERVGQYRSGWRQRREYTLMLTDKSSALEQPEYHEDTTILVA